MAAGIGASRVTSPTDGGPASVALVAGLLAGAAALLDRSGAYAAAGSAALLAHTAGVAAADLAVEGAGLAAVAAHAASAMRSTAPDTASDPADLRAAAVVRALLAALERATRPPVAPPEPAECGALPGRGCGTPFPAEVSFEIMLGDDEFAALRTALARFGPITAWPQGMSYRVHVHTDDPAGVIAEGYASGTLFDLVIGHRAGPAVGADGQDGA